MVDIEGFPRGEAAEEAQKKLLALEGVLSTRVIWTGSAQEGPANFYVAPEAC